MKTIYATMAAAVLLSTLAVSAEALPMPRATSAQDSASAVIPVADGCGWRRHWSRRFHRCVWNG